MFCIVQVLQFAHKESGGRNPCTARDDYYKNGTRGGDAGDCGYSLRFPSRSNDDQGNASDQDESTQNRRQGNPLLHRLSCVNRTQVHDLLLVRVRDALVSQGNNPQHNQQDPNPHWSFHVKATPLSLGRSFVADRPPNAWPPVGEHFSSVRSSSPAVPGAPTAPSIRISLAVTLPPKVFRYHPHLASPRIRRATPRQTSPAGASS